MGMTAEVLAVGPFSPSLIPHLTHPPDRYTSVQAGAILMERVFPYCLGSSSSRDLAAALDVDPWDFRTHVVIPERVDCESLRAVLALIGADVERAIDRFYALARAGFHFYFRPNG